MLSLFGSLNSFKNLISRSLTFLSSLVSLFKLLSWKTTGTPSEDSWRSNSMPYPARMADLNAEREFSVRSNPKIPPQSCNPRCAKGASKYDFGKGTASKDPLIFSQLTQIHHQPQPQHPSEEKQIQPQPANVYLFLQKLQPSSQTLH